MQALPAQCASLRCLQRLSLAFISPLACVLLLFSPLLPSSDLFGPPWGSANQGPWTFLSWLNEPGESMDARILDSYSSHGHNGAGFLALASKRLDRQARQSQCEN